MIQRQYLSLPLKGCTIAKLGVSFFLSVTAALTTVVPMAQAAYTPPEGGPSSGSTAAGGSRPPGCDIESTLPVEILAPFTHIGYSTTSTPTLAWFVTATEPYLVKVSVYHTDPNQGVQEIYRDIHLQEKGGVGYVTLPEDAPLVDGEQYDWQVSFACDIEASSYLGSVSSKLQVVSPTEPMVTDLTNALATTNSAEERADAYASRGYWFDALGELLMGGHDDAALSHNMANLLHELGTLEVGIETSAARLHGGNLLKISDALTGESITINEHQNSLTDTTIQEPLE